MIPEIMDLTPLKVPGDIQRDVKKLTQYLKDLTDSFNKLMKGVQRFNKISANELMARPTYAEEFQNIRDGVNKVIVPNDPEAWM